MTYDRLTSSWAEVPLAVDHPLVQRVDAVETAAWRAFVERVRIVSGESALSGRRVREVWDTELELDGVRIADHDDPASVRLVGER